MGNALWTSDRPEFLERLAKLAGGTTYRTPTAGRGTKLDQLPDAHAIATALAFARRRNEPDDIGPDVAYCWALGVDAYKAKVTRRLSDVLCRGTSLDRQHAALAIGNAWDAMIHNKKGTSKAPEDIDSKTWNALLLLVIGTLYNSAWDALAAAERAYYRAA